ncbi:DUF4430 domain-containing protein [Gaoshiqia sediminis]|uniref:DUF4430 domain-containing protein n=1 Tax=Gaoshiqia sediminis TaxID=2986998 RepID=A0AA42C7G5_9BACT|nr:DUF4430 domain-containing protein [Gaoshiqia sediminis]MCW0481561.1 DUF4430 domain-containing protein [Gaoshiqia sediminis]
MKLTTFFLGFMLMMLIGMPGVAGKAKFVTVEINYGDQKAPETIQVECSRSMTALEALQHAAKVKTHPVANYVFVTSINGVEAARGEMAWYYAVNGKKPKVAINQPVKGGDTISWRFVKDVCSCTVDK